MVTPENILHGAYMSLMPFDKVDTTPFQYIPQLRQFLGKEEAVKTQALMVIYVLMTVHPAIKNSSEFMGAVVDILKKEETGELSIEQACEAFIIHIKDHHAAIDGIHSAIQVPLESLIPTRQSLFRSEQRNKADFVHHILPLYIKYRLDPHEKMDTLAPKLLRRIAAAGNATDLEQLLTRMPSLDVNHPTPAPSPNAGKTAMHWVIKKANEIIEQENESDYDKLAQYEACFNALQAAGARTDVEDATQKTPMDYDTQSYFSSLNTSGLTYS